MPAALLAAAAPLLIKGVPYAIDALSPEARAARQDLRRDRLAMERGQLGMSGAEQQQITSAALRNIRAGRTSAEADAARAAAAGGPMVGSRMGGQAEAQRAEAAGVAAATLGAAQMSGEKAEAQRADIRQRQAEQRARRLAIATDIASTPLGTAAPDDFTGLRTIFGKK